MAAIGGDILEISFSNDSVGSGTFFAKSGESHTFDLGGLRNEVTTDGAGNPITKKNVVPWKMEVTLSRDVDTAEKINELAASLVPTTWDISHANGRTYTGVGTPTGDIAEDGNEATIPLTVHGGGKLSRQG